MAGCNPRTRHLTTGYANWQSGEVESLVPVGSTPTLGHCNHDPVVQRQRRLGDSQEERRFESIRDHCVKWSVGVSAARLLGKEEDRVRFPDGPLA